MNVGGRWYGVEDSTAVGALWEPWYRNHRLGAGLLNIITVLDKAAEPGPEHLEAARAWVDQSIGTVRKLFGDAPAGQPGDLLPVIRDTGEAGLSHADQSYRLKNSMRAATSRSAGG